MQTKTQQGKNGLYFGKQRFVRESTNRRASWRCPVVGVGVKGDTVLDASQQDRQPTTPTITWTIIFGPASIWTHKALLQSRYFTLCVMVGRPRMLLPPSFIPWEWRRSTRRKNATVSGCVCELALKGFRGSKGERK